MSRIGAVIVAIGVAVLTPLVGWAFIAHPMPHGLVGFVLLPTICGYAVYHLLAPEPEPPRYTAADAWRDFVVGSARRRAEELEHWQSIGREK